MIEIWLKSKYEGMIAKYNIDEKDKEITIDIPEDIDSWLYAGKSLLETARNLEVKKNV